MNPFRRLRRVLRFCAVAFCLFVILAAGGLWMVHRHLTKLTVQAINRSFPELELSAKTVGLSPAGIVDLKAIRLRVRRDGSTAVSIPSAQVRFSWNELRQQLVREVVIDQPSVRIGDSLLSALGLGPKSAASVEANESNAPWRIGKLTVTNGEARVDIAGQPSISTGFSLDLAEEGVASVNQVLLTDLRVRDGEARAEICSLSSVKVVASPEDLRRNRMREVVIDSPRLHLTDQVLALLSRKSTDSTPPPAWACDRLTLNEGYVQVDLGEWPKADVGVTLRAEHVAMEGGGAFEVALSGLGVQIPGDATRVLTVARIRVAGTASGVTRGVVQEIEIDQPMLNVTDRALAWRPPVPAAPSAPTASAPPPGAKIERLVLKGGQANVDLRGAPLARFNFGARLQNAGLGSESTEEVQSLEVLDFALRPRVEGVEPFLRIPAIRAEFRLPELIEKRRLARLRIEHLDFRYNTAFREMIASGAKPAPVSVTPSAAVPAVEPVPTPTIGELRLVDGRLHLDDLGVGIPGIECRLETAFRELAMEPGGGMGGQELQTIELSQIALRSPLDPFVTVLDLDTVFVRFTLAGLWARNIDEVAIVRPTLAIGPDLFWYIDRVQKNQDALPVDASPAVDDGPPWTIDKFSAKSGQLLLALEGQAKLALPMPFESRARNLNFRKLSDLRLKLQIEMPEQDYDYPSYELALRGVSGRVEFSLPPQKRKNNVVNTLRVKDVRWKNFRGRDVFLDVTYDELGVYGNLTGRGYSGILRGQFNFMLTPESDWDGWVAGTKIDLKPITAALAPEKFSLSSPADFRLSVKARASEILKVDGDFKATRGGDMRIGKLDEFIRDLPGDWSGVKKGLSRISLETLRDFSYDTAHGAFHFIGLVGAVHLDLQGPNGSRKIEMNFREADPSTPKSRMATTQP